MSDFMELDGDACTPTRVTIAGSTLTLDDVLNLPQPLSFLHGTFTTTAYDAEGAFVDVYVDALTLALIEEVMALRERLRQTEPTR